MTEHLKPCPFCGSDFVAHGVDGNNMVSVWCQCGARGPDFGFDVFNGQRDIGLAYSAWNNRVQTAACMDTKDTSHDT